MNYSAHNIYIHVPFCMSRCNYCAFFSRACAAPDWERYCTEICDEVLHWGGVLGRIDIPTVFFGGGTPSLMPVWCFDRIMTTIRKCFSLSHTAEVTLESNPGTLPAQKLHDFIKLGVNRLSVGVQSLDDTRLRFLGRRHSVTDALCLLDVACSAGVRVSADFIYGLPNDTVTDIENMCRGINDLGLTHCSLYELTIEPDTPFGRMNLEMPDNDAMAEMYNAIGMCLDLPRYEVSNYATPGNECIHNQNIWDGMPYIGIGIGAAGRVYLDGTWYEQLGAGAQFSAMADTDRTTEKILTGMRTVRGCRLTDDVKKVIDMNWVRMHPDLVQMTDERIFATDSGMLILDDITLNLVK